MLIQVWAIHVMYSLRSLWKVWKFLGPVLQTVVFYALVITPKVDCWLWCLFQILLQSRDYDRVLEKYMYRFFSILIPVDGVIMLLLDLCLFVCLV